MRGSVFGRPAATNRRSPTSTRRSASTPITPRPMPIARCIYRKTNKLDLALADYNKALAIDASYAPAYLGRGIVYREEGAATQALGDFNKAIALRPDNARSLLQSRPALSEPAPAPVRDRRFLDRDRAEPPEGRSFHRPRLELSRHRRQQVGGRAISTRRCSSIRGTCSAWTSRGLAYERTRRQGQGRRLLCQGAQYQRANTSRRRPALPASAARWARPTRRFSRVIPDCREAASPESILPALGLWIPGSSLCSAPE